MTDYFVDFSAGTGGGTGAFATPWHRLANITGTSPGDIIWCRRVSYTDTTTVGAPVQLPDSVAVIGWPLSTDADYAIRPVIAQAAWDGDAAEHATIVGDNPSTAAGNFHLVQMTSATGPQTLKRFRVRMRIPENSNSSSVRLCVDIHTVVASALKTVRYCYFEVEPRGTWASSTPPAWIQGGAYQAPLTIGNDTLNTFYMRVEDTTSVCRIPAGSLSGVAPLVIRAGPSAGDISVIPGFRRCTFVGAGQYSNTWIGENVLRTGAGSRIWRMRTTFIDCTFRSDVVVQTALFHPWQDSADRTIPRTSFIRCKWQVPPGQPNSTGVLDATSSYYEDCEADGVGGLNLTLSGLANWRRITQRTPRTDGIAYLGCYGRGYTFVCDNVTFVPGNSADLAFPESDSNTVILRNVIQGTGGYSVIERNRVILADYDGLVGTWKQITTAGTIESSPVFRVGGEQFSLAFKMSPSGGPVNQMQPRCYPLTAGERGEETIAVRLAPGSRTVTLYGCTVGFTGSATEDSATKSTVWFDLIYAQSTETMYATSRVVPDPADVGPALDTDASTWSGVTSPTPFKMTINLTIVDETVAVFRIRSSASRSSDALVYIDPKPVVT